MLIIEYCNIFSANKYGFPVGVVKLLTDVKRQNIKQKFTIR